MSAFDDLSAIPPLRIWGGVVGRPIHGDELTLTLIELEPDSVVPEHEHVNEQVGILLRGSLRFRIGEEERELARGGTWCIHAHVPHEVRSGPDGAILVEAFAPARADWAALERLDPGPPAGL